MAFRGYAKRTERALELALFTAWQTARYRDYEPKKRPRLADEIAKLQRSLRPRRRQSRAEMIAAMRTIAARSIH